MQKLRVALSRARYVARGLRQPADPSSLWRLLRLRIDRRLPERMRLPREPLELRLRALDRGPLSVRPGTTDLDMALHDYVEGFHLPPEPARNREMTRIVEFGCNAGGALAWYATHYPKAQILGVEADPENARQAERNVARFGGRCRVVAAAVGEREGQIVLGDGLAHSIQVLPESDPAAASAERLVSMMPISRLLEAHMPEGPIDFMMITVEGSEYAALSDRDIWAPRVNSLRIELNTHISGLQRDEAEAILRDLGFEAWSEDILGPVAFGVRRPAGS